MLLLRVKEEVQIPVYVELRKRKMSVGGAEERGSTVPGYSRNNLIPSHALQIPSRSFYTKDALPASPWKEQGRSRLLSLAQPKISSLPRKARAVLKGVLPVENLIR